VNGKGQEQLSERKVFTEYVERKGADEPRIGYAVRPAAQ
jgi:hypothetical protein